MSILVADNFKYQGRKPLDSRLSYDTIADMIAQADSVLYEGIIAYNKETEKWYTFSPNNDVTVELGKWVEFTVGGGSSVEEYKQGVPYMKDTLVVIDGKLYIVSDDFTSDNTDGNTLEDSAQADIDAGNLVLISADAEGYQPTAPEKHTLAIDAVGAGYVVGDIVETTTDGIFAEVLAVGANGEVEEVQNSDADAAVTTGAGAAIIVEPIFQVGYDGEWYDMPISEGSADAVLLESITSNIDVGGAPSGTLFAKDTTFTEFAKMILRKTIIPTIKFEATGTGLHEVGTTVNGSTLKVTITNIGAVTTSIDGVQFTIDGTVVDTPIMTDGQNVYTYVDSTPFTENTTLGVILTYDTNKTVTGAANIKFVKASYYGAVDVINPTADEILALTKTVKDGKAFTWTGAELDDQRFCYAYPASMGNLSSIKDANNFEYINSYTKSTIEIDGTNYNVYVLTDPVTITNAKQVYA